MRYVVWISGISVLHILIIRDYNTNTLHSVTCKYRERYGFELIKELLRTYNYIIVVTDYTSPSALGFAIIGDEEEEKRREIKKAIHVGLTWRKHNGP